MRASFSLDFFFFVFLLPSVFLRRSGFEMARRDVDDVIVVGGLQWTVENTLDAEKDSARDAMEARRSTTDT
jgi:hypothetical protein